MFCKSYKSETTILCDMYLWRIKQVSFWLPYLLENSLIMWGLHIFSCLPKHSCYKLLKYQQFIKHKVTRMYFHNNKQNTIPDSKYLLSFIITLPSNSKIRNFTLKQSSRDVVRVRWVYNFAIIQSYNYNEILFCA